MPRVGTFPGACSIQNLPQEERAYHTFSSMLPSNRIEIPAVSNYYKSSGTYKKRLPNASELRFLHFVSGYSGEYENEEDATGSRFFSIILSY